MSRLLIICLLLTGCVSGTDVEEPPKNDVVEQYDNRVSDFKQEYEELNGTYETITINEDAKINYLENDEVLDFLQTETGIVYFGRATCPHCRVTIPNLVEAATANDMYIHYVNSDKYKSSDDYSMTIDYLSPYLEELDGNKVIYVPDVYFVKNGEIIDHVLGSTTYDDYVNKIAKIK